VYLPIYITKVKPSHYRPGQALMVPGGWGSQISRQSAHEGGKVVSHKHRPPLPPRKYSWYSFLLEVESTPGLWPKDYVNEKFQLPASGIEPTNLCLVAQCLYQLRHRVPRFCVVHRLKLLELYFSPLMPLWPAEEQIYFAFFRYLSDSFSLQPFSPFIHLSQRYQTLVTSNIAALINITGQPTTYAGRNRQVFNQTKTNSYRNSQSDSYTSGQPSSRRLSQPGSQSVSQWDSHTGSHTSRNYIVKIVNYQFRNMMYYNCQKQILH
jgi:hypothetical protein